MAHSLHFETPIYLFQTELNELFQIAEASKVYAKEKEEEVKLLECSVEELEDTINILEKKVK